MFIILIDIRSTYLNEVLIMRNNKDEPKVYKNINEAKKDLKEIVFSKNFKHAIINLDKMKWKL